MESGDLPLLLDALNRYQAQADYDFQQAVGSPAERAARKRAADIHERVSRIKAWLTAAHGQTLLATSRTALR